MNFLEDLPYQGFLIDIDGVICRGSQLIKGAGRAIKQLKKSEKEVVFVSNNSSQSPSSYRKKMLDLGVKAKEEDFILATVVAAKHILTESPSAKVYVIGAEGLRQTMDEYGLETTEEAMNSDYVVIGNPFKSSGGLRSGHDKRITEAIRSIIPGKSSFIAINMDRRFPTPEGPVPATGAIVKALMHATGRSPSLIAGKPNVEIISLALDRLGLEPEKCVMIGDSRVDILAARNAGLDSIFIKTGSAGERELEDEGVTPNFTLESIRDLTG